MDDLAQHFSVPNLKDIFEKDIKNKTGKGIDGISSVQLEKDLHPITTKVSDRALNSKYRFSPYLEIAKSKGRGKAPRIISKPTIRDKLALYALKDILHGLYETSIQKQLPNTFIREIKTLLEEKSNDDIYFLKVDIHGFYDNLNHEILLSHCLQDIKNPNLIALIRRAIKNKTVPKNYKKSNSSKYHNSLGVPQGLSISNVLAGIYMKDFDNEFSQVGLSYFRYVDDILVFAKKGELEEIENNIESALDRIALRTNEKTEKGIISKSFDYLGYQISSEKISIRESTIDRYITAIIAMFTDFKMNFNYRIDNSKWLTPEHVKDLFILSLNEKITGAITEKKRYGWVFYFIEVTDIYLLHKLDSIISKQFSKLDMFDNTAPQELKKIVKSHYSAKYSTFDGYIHNYAVYDSIIKKIKFLVDFGYLNENETKKFREDEIERKFEVAKMTRLMKLEEDIGNIS